MTRDHESVQCDDLDPIIVMHPNFHVLDHDPRLWRYDLPPPSEQLQA